MPTVTLLNATGTKWGTSGYTNEASPFTLGRTADYTCRGRVGFAALNPAWYIKSIRLYMNRTDGYAGKTLKLGANQSGDYANRGMLDWSLNLYASKGTGAKSWDLTVYKAILQGYPGIWYLHFDHGSGDSSYCEWTAGSGSGAPRLVAEYEEATLSVPGGAFTIGTASAIMVGTAGSGLTHKVSYSVGASSGALNGGAAVSAGGTISWTPDAALASQIMDGMVGTVTLMLESYLNGVLSSSIPLDYPLNVPASYVPTINGASTTFALLNPVGDSIGVYVQGRSRTVCAISAASVYGAVIREYRLTLGGKTYTAPAGTITTDVLSSTGALTATIEVTDSRGQKATLTRSAAITVNSYFAPMVTGFSVARATSDGSLSNDGTSIKFTLTCVFAAIANKNAKSGSMKFKVTGGTYSAPVSLDAAMAAAGATVYSFTITGVIGSGAIGSGGYTVSVTLTDKYTTAPEALAELPSRKILFDLHSSGEGVAIGGVASAAGWFDSYLPARFRDDLRCDGMVYARDVGQIGNRNLTYNPAFYVDTAGWELAVGVTRDASKSLNGYYSLHNLQSGLETNAWRGARSAVGYRAACSVGDVFTMSVYVYMDNYATVDNGICAGIDIFNAAGTRVQFGSTSIRPDSTHNGKWTKMVYTLTVTASDAAFVAAYPYLNRNGDVWFAAPKLEAGNVETEYVRRVGSDTRFDGNVWFGNPAAALAVLGVRAGKYSLSRSSWAAGTNYAYAVTFDTPLPAAPTAVIVGFVRSADGLDAYSISTNGYTANGFILNIARNAARSAATDFTVCYIAI